jgi:hypothetical protein
MTSGSSLAKDLTKAFKLGGFWALRQSSLVSKRSGSIHLAVRSSIEPQHSEHQQHSTISDQRVVAADRNHHAGLFQ